MNTEGTDREVLIGMAFREKDFLSYEQLSCLPHDTGRHLAGRQIPCFTWSAPGGQNELWVLGSRGRLLLKRGVDDAACLAGRYFDRLRVRHLPYR